MRRLRLAIKRWRHEGKRLQIQKKKALFLCLTMKIWPRRIKRDEAEKRNVICSNDNFSRKLIFTNKQINSKSWIISLCFSWRRCSIYCCIVSLLLRLPSKTFCKIKSLRLVSSSAILDSYESAVAFLPHLIELNSTLHLFWRLKQKKALISEVIYCFRHCFTISTNRMHF